MSVRCSSHKHRGRIVDILQKQSAGDALFPGKSICLLEIRRTGKPVDADIEYPLFYPGGFLERIRPDAVTLPDDPSPFTP